MPTALQDEHLGPREVIEESAQDRFVNSNTYGKRKTAARWTKVETEMFFDVRHRSSLVVLLLALSVRSLTCLRVVARAGRLAIRHRL